MYELSEIRDISYVPAQIEFPQYGMLLDQARAVAAHISTVEVTPENMKESKDLLARSRKAIKILNDERIRINKEILKPYEVFKSQIKDIETVLDEANTKVNEQVKALEEIERTAKKYKVMELWSNQVQSYKYKDLVEFEHFFEERHVNKSLSMSKIEDEMAEFLAKTEKDIDYLKSKGQGEYVAEYLTTFDLTDTLQTVEARQSLVDKVNSVEPEEVIVGEEKATFEITGKANITLVEMLLKQNEIKYRKF